MKKSLEQIQKEIEAIKINLEKLDSVCSVENSIKYYSNNHTAINSRRMEFVHEGKLHEDVFKANTKITKNDYRTIVDQLTSYLLGKQPTITNVDDSIVDKFPLKKAWSIVKKALKKCQIQKVAWIQPYINSKNEVAFALRERSDNILPIYSYGPEKELIAIILYYDIDILDGGEIKTITRYEYWDKEEVTYYKQENDVISFWECDDEITRNPQSHVYTSVDYPNGKSVIKGKNKWGKVPFIPLWFNEENQTALELIGKEKIDALDFLLSDGCNNFLDMADVIYVLRDYIGDPSEALFNLKTKRGAAVGGKGDISTVNNEIPMESRQLMIKIIKQAIYEDGMSPDLSNLMGSNITNVLIESMFETLDMKANNIASEIELVYNEMLSYIYIKENNFDIKEGSRQMKEANIKFNKTMIVNEIEYINASTTSDGSVSDETRWSYDPRVDDPEKEADRIKAEELEIE